MKKLFILLISIVTFSSCVLDDESYVNRMTPPVIILSNVTIDDYPYVTLKDGKNTIKTLDSRGILASSLSSLPAGTRIR